MASPDGQPGQDIKIDQPKAALGIRQFLVSYARKPAAHPLVYKASEPRHFCGLHHPIAHYQSYRTTFCAFEKVGNIIRGMLTVAVQCQRPDVSSLFGLLPAGTKRSPFSLINRVAHNVSASP